MLNKILKEEMDERGWSEKDLAIKLNCSEHEAKLIINSDCIITNEMANALALAFEVSPELFINLQKNITNPGCPIE